MHLQYNGIDLRVVRPVLVSRQVKYDPTGKDYLGTVWNIQVVALYSPDHYQMPPPERGYSLHVTAHSNGAPRTVRRGTEQPETLPNPLKPDQGLLDAFEINHQPRFNSPVWTDAALRHRLAQPRGTLRVVFNSGLDPVTFPGLEPDQYGLGGGAPNATGAGVGAQLWVESPGRLPGRDTEAHCDLDNGPKPAVIHVEDVFGDGRLFTVVFGVETTVNDCATNTGPEAEKEPLLSNQWTATHSYDDQYLCTRTVQGMAVFRADVVNRFVKDPDRFQLKLLPPVALNCKRYIDELTQHPDGYTYSYTVRDVEQALTYMDTPFVNSSTYAYVPGRTPRNVTVFDVQVDRSYEQVGTKAAANSFINMMGQMRFAELHSENKGGFVTRQGQEASEAGKSVPGLPGLAVWAIGKGLEGLGKQIDFMVDATVKGALFLNEFLPTFTETITVTVAGNRYAKMKELQYLAFSAAFGLVTPPMGLRLDLAKYAKQALKIAGGLGVNMASDLVTGALPGNANLRDSQGGPEGAGVRAGASGSLSTDKLAFLATANVYNLSYSPTRKQLSFSLTTSYSGLVDWLVGGTAGGWRAITGPIHDDVTGGDWPQSALNNIVISKEISGFSANEARAHLPPLPDKDVVIATAANVYAVAPPRFQRGDGTPDVVLGSNVTKLIAHKLLEECDLPGKLVGDSELSTMGAPGQKVGDAVLRTSGKQLLP